MIRSALASSARAIPDFSRISNMAITHITVHGARQHNLRDIHVSIPRNTLTVITGLSGSGKSSLAFDTIYAEGQRRYVETLSTYARQFLDQIERPDVDSIEGLSPAISIEQKTTSRSPRSTVGTITEIYDYLRLLFASVGVPHCPHCGNPISRQSPEQIVERILALTPGERVIIYAPVVRGRKGEFKDLLDELDQQGFRARIDGELRDLAENIQLDKRKNHTIEAIVDRVVLKAGDEKLIKRLEASVAKSLQMANGLVLIGFAGTPNGAAAVPDQLYSSSMACPDCGLDIPKLEPRSFSFNSTYGACPNCHGLGSIYDFDPAKVISDWSRPLLDGGLGPGSASQYLHQARRSRRAEIQDRSRASPSSNFPRSSRHYCSTAHPRTKRLAPDFTASSPICATGPATSSPMKAASTC